jgi:hypothetical protein
MSDLAPDCRARRTCLAFVGRYLPGSSSVAVPISAEAEGSSLPSPETSDTKA